MSVIEVEFPGNIAAVRTIPDLRALPSGSFTFNDLYVVTGKGLYTWVPDSFAVDDGDKVIKPNDLTPLQVGRWLFGPQGSTGPADNTYTTLTALLASDPGKKSARLVPQDGELAPAGNFNYINGAWVRQTADGILYQQVGAQARVRSQQDKSRETVSINDFGGIGDGTTDNTAALNSAILALCQRGGGRVVFGASDAAYYFAGSVPVPSGIHVDLSGETLRGNTGDLFHSGVYLNGQVISNVSDGNEINIVQNASIRNGCVRNAARVFNFKNWNQECVIADIQTRDCPRVGYYKRCFSSSFINVTARGSSSLANPTHHFDQQTNSVILDRVKCVTEYCFKFTGGTNVVDITGCEAEGGTNAFTFEGDCLGLSFRGNYLEALGGTAFDFSKAGACSVFFQGNYINGVKVCFDDGGVSNTSTLAGVWLPDNERVNSIGNGFQNLMYIAGSRDFIEWNDRSTDDPILSNGVGWVQNISSRYRREQRWNANLMTDVRAVAKHFGSGIVPRAYGGNSGNPLTGTVPFSTYALPVGSAVAATVTTSILLSNNASFIVFSLLINDNTGSKKVSGIVFGDYVMQAQGSDRPVTVSQNAQGYALLSIGAINNANGAVTLTGTVGLI